MDRGFVAYVAKKRTGAMLRGVKKQRFGKRRFWIRGSGISIKEIGIRTVGCKNIGAVEENKSNCN
jgi:hypothetical protein